MLCFLLLMVFMFFQSVPVQTVARIKSI